LDTGEGDVKVLPDDPHATRVGNEASKTAFAAKTTSREGASVRRIFGTAVVAAREEE
jgi:hypothetical protein